MLAGGASQEAWLVDVALAGAPDPLRLVMRRDMGGALTTMALDRATEFAVLQVAYAGGVPAPRPYFAPATIAGKAAFFMERVDGETVGRKIVTEPSLAEARAALPVQLARALAAIHALDAGAPEIAGRLQRPAAGQSAIGVELARLYAELDAVGEPHPALEYALRRLALAQPPGVEPSFVHGDFRIGNVVVDGRGLRAVLDWEFAHAGDPYEDLAWPCVRAWRFGNDALAMGGIADREAWLLAYEGASGRPVDRDRVAYHEILGNVKWAVGALMQARRHLTGEERSIELASLGRIAAEMELEALALLAARDGHAASPDGAAPAPEPAESIGDRPSAGELIAAVREYLQAEVVPQLDDRRARFRALIAQNVLAVVERELATQPGDVRAEHARLDALGLKGAGLLARRQDLAGRIRRGEYDAPGPAAAVAAYARRSVVAKLRVANPRYLERFARS